MTREEWLGQAITRLRPAYKHVGLTLPEVVHVSVGFPSVGALSKTKMRIGECWMARSSIDGNPNVFIHPFISDGVEALAVLVHELIHACGIADHKAGFKIPAMKLGLEGKMAHTSASLELKAKLILLLSKLGPYPHPGITPQDRPVKKQTTRLLKAECECGAIIRLTQKVIDDPGLPTCACGGEFNVADNGEEN